MSSPDILAIARQWLHGPLRLVASGGGGNSRVHHLATDHGDYALKLYPPMGQNGWDRQGTEHATVAFMQEQGITGIPRLVAWDREHRATLFHWLSATPVAVVDQGVAQQMLAFLKQLQTLEKLPGARLLPPASDACLTPMAARKQFDRRFRHLLENGHGAGLHPFLTEALAPVAQPLLAGAARQLGKGWEEPLSPELAMLSPSDFGAHNALRGTDGRLVFVDFEYFGWDDPIKLTCDLLWHPAMDLAPAVADGLRRGIATLRGGDRGFAQRLAALYPVFGLIWCLILLNPFLPGRGQEAVQKQRLARAGQYLAALYRIQHGKRSFSPHNFVS